MLLGRMPGEFVPTHVPTALPPYAALLKHYFDCFGAYRPQPHTTPPIILPRSDYTRSPVPTPSVMLRPGPDIPVRRPTVTRDQRGNGPAARGSRSSRGSPSRRETEAKSRGYKGPSAGRGPKGG